MQFYDHLMASFTVLFLLFHNSVSLPEIIVFAVVWGVLIDTDQLIGRYIKKPVGHRRTWIEEPFGLLFFGVPAGLILSAFKPEYFLMTIIPYGLHIVMDYISIHKVSPLAPFSDREYLVGFIRAFPRYNWCTEEHKGIPEYYFTVINVLALILLITSYF